MRLWPHTGLLSGKSMFIDMHDIDSPDESALFLKWQSLSFRLWTLMLILLNHYMFTEVMWCKHDNINK